MAEIVRMQAFEVMKVRLQKGQYQKMVLLSHHSYDMCFYVLHFTQSSVNIDTEKRKPNLC